MKTGLVLGTTITKASSTICTWVNWREGAQVKLREGGVLYLVMSSY